MKLKTLVGIAALPFLINCTQIPPIGPSAPVEEKKYPLDVWSVTPTWAVYEEEMIVTIHGTGFDEDSLAFIGGNPCRKTIVMSHSAIHCMVTKPTLWGDQSVTVQNSDGTIRPVKLTLEQKKAMCDKRDRECLESDGLVYFYFVKPIEKLQ